MTRRLLALNGTSIRRVVFVALAAPACYLAYQLGVALGPVGARPGAGAGADSSPSSVNGLEIAAGDLDIGEVWEDPNFVRPVMVTNRGDQTAVVVDLRGGCECTAVEPSSFTLGSGQSQRVRVKIDLTHRYPHQFGVERRELAVGLYPFLKDRGATAGGWRVTGVIKSRVSLEGRGLAFADMCGQGGPPVTRRMRATAHVPLAGLEASCPADMATVGVRPTAGQPGQYDVLVTPHPNLPLGPFKFEVAVTAIEPGGRKSPCASFTVDGEMGSPIRVVPNPVLLGEHQVGARAEALVSIRLPAVGWSVERVETELPETAITSADPVEGRPAYRVTQPVVKAGDQTCQVRFVVRRPTGPLEAVPLVLRWHGESHRQEVKP